MSARQLVGKASAQRIQQQPAHPLRDVAGDRHAHHRHHREVEIGGKERDHVVGLGGPTQVVGLALQHRQPASHLFRTGAASVPEQGGNRRLRSDATQPYLRARFIISG